MAPSAIESATIAKARSLRRDMTEGERKLWSELRAFHAAYGVHVRRQAPIGPYVVDFAMHDLGLIIEVDGEHHELPDRKRRDAERDAWLESQGYRTIRINTGELSDAFDGCIETILHEAGLRK